MKAKIIVITIVVIAVIVAISYLLYKKKVSTSLTTSNQAPQTLGGQIYGDVSNPVKNKLPETNPFKTETNPFKNAYKNPFGQ